MSYLDLAGWPEQGADQGFICVLGAMLFPDDEEQRNAVATLPAIPLWHHAVDMITKKYLERFHHGQAAGDVSFVVRQIAEHHPDAEAGLQRAAIVVEQDARRHSRQSADGRQFFRDEKTIRDAFSNYRNVAHLWTAWDLSTRWAQTLPEKLDVFFGVFLAVAEDMRRFGEAHIMPRKLDPLLRSENTWKIPDGLDLPDLAVTLPPLTPSALEDLQQYRARPR